MDRENDCTHENALPKRLFCSECGRLLEPGSLRSIRFQGFLGCQSTNPKMEEFWATGDPEVFDRP